MFALDTNTLIYFFKRQGNVAARLLSHAPVDVVVPCIVVYELEVGLAKSAQPALRRAQLDTFLRHTRILPLTRFEATHAARIRASLEAGGKPIGPLDTLIAGIALAHGATLVTRNADEFSRVPGLAVDNWYG
ncbi:MAG: type II toxin-antitoxin system VapC family toxin [Betaproteobacteria bacterium]|nr:MAG: type II toxin-antitoxin system VapC family toxin [Betaproteobacteria bacterium]TAG47969.1 MAG: type II toxin-antitoxin system VapC family toxin [Betaproteobacteria bacterium]